MPDPSDDQPRHEEALAAARLAAIVASSDDAIVSKTLDGVITAWNPGAERLFGWTPEEAIGRHITLIIPADRRAEEDQILAHVRRGERVDHFETIRVTRDGRLIDISLSVSPIRDARGRIVGASKIAHDISARRKAEAERGRLAAIVDSADDVIVGKTLDGVITSWNPAAERRFGWTAQEAVGRHITLIIPPERWAEEEQVLALIRGGDRVEHFETVRVTKDGRLVDMSITVSPIRDAAGRIIGASKVGRDISERRRLEEARARLLEREQAARRQAEALNRTKDELLATVSHELRTPLNSIFGWARMLQSSDMNEATRARAVNAILRGATAQARLVEDLLDLSRVVTGRMRLDFQTIDLNAVVEAALETVRPAASAKEIALVARLDRSLRETRGAPDRLQQVVWNLVMNAVKFTPRGGRIDVSVRRGERTVDIVVQDTGEGIAPDVLPHVFEPFRQEDSSSTRTHGGLGLGLALVRHLVELHGGEVRAESPGKGGGSTFTVTLPLAAETVGRRTRQQDAEDGGQRAMLDGLRVLVVDDDDESLEMSATMLHDAGASVRTAASAFRAYEVVESWQPDVVVTDLAMPGEDGFMLLHVLRTAFARALASVPFIAVTAYGTAESRARALEAGFDLYLAKPIDPLALTGAVAEVARRGG